MPMIERRHHKLPMGEVPSDTSWHPMPYWAASGVFASTPSGVSYQPVKYATGSATPQNIKPMPMPAANSMASQDSVECSACASVPPIRILPHGEMARPKQKITKILPDQIKNASKLAMMSHLRPSKRFLADSGSLTRVATRKIRIKPALTAKTGL